MPLNPKKSKKNSAARPRLSGEARREQIIEAAIPLFSREGFRGVTTKMLARESGVSEALLYQHFPSKEAVYEAVQKLCIDQHPPGLGTHISALPPSTETLVLLLFFLSKVVVERPSWKDVVQDVFTRLMLHSVLEDGAFARMHIISTAGKLETLMRSSFDAARRSGDLADDGMPDDLRFWLCHHVMVTMHLYQLPTPPIVPYSETDPKRLIQHSLGFMLRGIGLSAAAIARHFHYQQLESTVSRWTEPVPEP